MIDIFVYVNAYALLALNNQYNTIMKTLRFEYKRETDRELKHIDVYLNDLYVGYIIKDNPLVGAVKEWHFTTKVDNIPNMAERTKKEIIIKLKTFI